jgi:AcrR family transcriptional regulator
VATPQRPPRRPLGRAAAKQDAAQLRDDLVDAVAEKVSKKVVEAIDKAATKTKHKHEQHRHKPGVEALERLAAHLDALEVWTRDEGAGRKPRFSRDEIAATAVRIADEEGFEALSMRRLAAELGAGTMTIYHYVKTKDELLMLVNDAVMGEVVLPEGWDSGLTWRQAITEIAEATRASLQAHPWIFDISDDPPLGPNTVRHFDQTMAALATLELPLAERLDLASVLDEYVFGYCLHERNNLHPDNPADGIFSDGMVEYMDGLISTGAYPELSKLSAEVGLEASLRTADAIARDPARFRRNLDRILDGIEVGLQRQR